MLTSELAVAVGVYVALAALLFVAGTSDLLKDVPDSIGICLFLAALASAGYLGFQHRARLSLKLGSIVLIMWLTIGDIAGLDSHFDGASAVNGIVLLALLLVAAGAGSTMARRSSRRRRA